MEIKKSETNYNDGYIDIHAIAPTPYGCFSDPLVVFVNSDGDTKVVNEGDGFYSPKDLVEAYEELFTKADPDNKEGLEEGLKEFKAYLLEQGVTKEELE